MLESTMADTSTVRTTPDEAFSTERPTYDEIRRDDRHDKSERFELAWKEIHGGFTLGTDGARTPMLEDFTERLKDMEGKGQGTKFKVMEAGSGSGIQAIEIAKDLGDQANILAIDTSIKAREVLDDNVAEEGLEWQIKSRQKDIYDVIEKQDKEAADLDGFYANSVLHFIHPRDRAGMYHGLHRVMKDGAVLAVSFKSAGDFLESEGDFLRNEPGGRLVKGKDGIVRIFVHDQEVFKSELQSAGFEDIQVHEWEVTDYNSPGKTAKFIGFTAVKKTPDYSTKK